jgi:hypothetical protein
LPRSACRPGSTPRRSRRGRPQVTPPPSTSGHRAHPFGNLAHPSPACLSRSPEGLQRKSSGPSDQNCRPRARAHRPSPRAASSRSEFQKFCVSRNHSEVVPPVPLLERPGPTPPRTLAIFLLRSQGCWKVRLARQPGLSIRRTRRGQKDIELSSLRPPRREPVTLRLREEAGQQLTAA